MGVLVSNPNGSDEAKVNLVLIHGWGFLSQVWNACQIGLENDFNIYLVSLPGYGDAKHETGDYVLEKLLNDLLNILPEKFVVCGWSLGGGIAFNLAHRDQKRVQAVINIASAPSFIQRDNDTGMSEESFSNFQNTLIKQGVKMFPRFAGLCVKGDVNEKRLWKVAKQFVVLNDGEYLHDSLNLLKEMDCRDMLQHSSALKMVPQLNILAQNDALINPCCFDELDLHHVQIDVINNVSHAMIISDAPLIAGKIKAFLNVSLKGKNCESC